jgi:hypothetical protein
MTNQIFSDLIQQMKTATSREIGVVDPEGNVIACSNPGQIAAKYPRLAYSIAVSEEQVCCASGRTGAPAQ